MKKYTTNGMRSVTAESMTDAAELFANRIARKTYGRRAYARTCACGSQSRDGSIGEYNAFVGVSGPERGMTTGKNVFFTVYAN